MLSSVIITLKAVAQVTLSLTVALAPHLSTLRTDLVHHIIIGPDLATLLAAALLKKVLRLLFVRRKLKAHERALGALTAAGRVASIAAQCVNASLASRAPVLLGVTSAFMLVGAAASLALPEPRGRVIG